MHVVEWQTDAVTGEGDVPQRRTTFLKWAAAMVAGVSVCVGCAPPASNDSSSDAGPGDAGLADGGTPFQPVNVSSAVAKVKNLLVGLPPTDAEVQAVTANPSALSGLVQQWMALPQYNAKMQQFFAVAFQQTQSGVTDFADQFNGHPPFQRNA